MKNVRGWFRRRARDVQRGFTLLEIMIVLAIMGLIVTVVSVQVFKQLKKARVSAARLGVKKIADATARSMAGGSTGCPKGIDDLIAQGELSKNDAKDPWGTPYTYKCPGAVDPDGADVISAGPDKQTGTDDDIKSE
jgi:general secretion pathway protein G